MTAVPKLTQLRDRKYLDFLRTQPCLFTGEMGTEPAHIGTAGKGLKIGDDQAIPLVHWLHRRGHQHGEISMIRANVPDWLLRDALRLYAQQMYREWKDPRP